MSKYTEITRSEITYIERIDENGQVWAIPIEPSNADYQAYLNKDTLASELSNPSTPQAGE